ncbi:MAG TPA: response regulator transcription factor [Rhodanobacteraceae bacterium]|nr:response regulator transcription factor [Rhodanobacteraceae bacterium]
MDKLDLVVGLLEDDADQAAIVTQWLEEAGYTVRVFRAAAEFRRRQGAESIDLLLLDWMLPDTAGIDVLGWIRASGNSRLPVIFLTARDAEEDLVRALSSGGDDYVVKPPKRGELLARVNALLRRHGANGSSESELDLGPYRIDMQRRRITLNGREVDLTQREFDLANFLFRRQGRIVGRDALLEHVWNLSAAVSTRTVDTHVSRLRKKLDLNGENGWRLAAIYQHGYRLEQV